MDQQDFQKEMTRIEKNNKWKNRKLFLILGGLVALLVAYINISKFIKNNEEEKARYEADKTSFIEDSVWLVNVLSKQNQDQFSIDVLTSLDNRIKGNFYGSEKSKIHLLNKLISIKVTVDTGTRILDEFDKVSLVKDKTKTVLINFGDKDKYKINRIYQGFANAKNRKAHKLKLKYPYWNTNECLTVSNRRINIGMTKEMVREAWGRPEDINRTTNAYGTSEQWVYGYSYVYFDDDICTTIQN
ncbi:MAG: hypothetical protein IPI19_02830 [Ignavibacteriales bacterium]|nr:hypothetical protein [Ignavibacteriales bacterium]